MQGESVVEFSVVALLVAATGFVWFAWKQGVPRRQSLATLARLQQGLAAANSASILETISLPAAIQGRTAPEQTEFLTKALRDEISPEGLAVLRRHGQFAPLTNLFPTEAQAWAEQAGVKPEDCVAFKLERNGLRAEVVLIATSSNQEPVSGIQYRILRLNNVKLLANSTAP